MRFRRSSQASEVEESDDQENNAAVSTTEDDFELPPEVLAQIAEEAVAAPFEDGKPSGTELDETDSPRRSRFRRGREHEVAPEELPLDSPAPVGESEVEEALDHAQEEFQEESGEESAGRRSRFRRARSVLSLGAIRSRGRVDESVLQELEESLLLADVGLPTTTRLLDALRVRVRGERLDGDGLIEALREEIVALFDGDDLGLQHVDGETNVWLFVGVNGVGKTTTAAKLAQREIAAGRKVVLAAGDTFRAAAGDQLEAWATRTGASIIRGADGVDPSSVVFDAVSHAHARGADLVLADSAGRLHSKVNLMEELAKIRRVADRPPGKVAEVLLVLDATTGQNGLVQARSFTEAIGVTGIVLTKLDGSARGGIVLAIRAELGIPIKLVGLGEGADDLVVFDAEEFADALLQPV